MMLRIFKRIKNQLIGEGKTRQYLLYGIGEILLVVIGILIALQVNNWNENRNARKAETRTLLTLEAELYNNFLITEDIYRSNSSTLDTLTRFFKGEYKQYPLRRKAEITMILFNHSPLQLNMPALIQELNTSPKIQSKPEVREGLFKVSYCYQQVNKRLAYLDDTWTNHLSPLMTSEGAGRSFLNLYMEWDEGNYEIGKLMDYSQTDDILSVKFAQLQPYTNWIDSLRISQQEALRLIENTLQN